MAWRTGSPADRETFRRALADFEETVQRILARTGMTEDEITHRLFDLNEPLPEEIEGTSSPNAPGR
jgi:hypothetical protein